MGERLEQGSLKGTIIRILSIDGYSLDLTRLQSAVEKDLGKPISNHSLRGTVNNLVNQGYLERTAKGVYKATRECVEGNVYGPMSEQTLKHALSNKKCSL